MALRKRMGTHALAGLSYLPYFKGKGRIALAILKLSQSMLPLPIRLCNGARMWQKLDNSGYHILPYWIGRYEVSFQRLFLDCCRHLNPGESVIDVGANVGFYAMLAAQELREHAHSHVFAFEPYLALAPQIVENAKLNGFANVHVIGDAVGRQSGSTHFYVNPGAVTVGSLAQVNAMLDTQITVQVKALDTWHDQHPERIGLLKADIEGGELAAFQGGKELLRRDQPYLLFEEDDGFCRAFGHKAHDVRTFLADLGYQLYVIEPDGRTGYRLVAADKAPVLPVGQRNLFGLTSQRALPA